LFRFNQPVTLALQPNLRDDQRSSIYLLNFVKAGQPGVKRDEEATGYGWKTETFMSAKDTAPAIKCQIDRPPT
jgi:hypothetical protein